MAATTECKDNDFAGFGSFLRNTTSQRPKVVPWNGLVEALAGPLLREQGVDDLHSIKDLVHLGKSGTVSYPRDLIVDSKFTLLAVPIPRLGNIVRPAFDQKGAPLSCKELFRPELRDRRRASDTRDDMGTLTTDVCGWIDLFLWLPNQLGTIPGSDVLSSGALAEFSSILANSCNDNLFQVIDNRLLITTKLWFPSAWGLRNAILSEDFSDRYSSGHEIPVFMFKNLFFQKTTMGGKGR
jgi:hypothetical protein